MKKPVVAVTFGDACGIGPELVARLLARPEIKDVAQLVLVGDAWVWADAQRAAGMTSPVKVIHDWKDVRSGDGVPLFLQTETVSQADVIPGEMTPAAGTGARLALTDCLDAVRRGDSDAICFAPLNKQAMKKGGMDFEDELHFFADYFGVTEYFCEFNTLGTLWTSRISSHIPLADIPKYVTKDRIKAAARLTYKTLKNAGFAEPRVAVAALNPHGGDGGTCGREEIDIIEPAARELNAEGFPIQGPYPADTIFLKARDGVLDSIVTMYHDQGLPVLKYASFGGGVNITLGLPFIRTSVDHGTALDLAGHGGADPGSLHAAVAMARDMVMSMRGRAA